MPARTSQHLFGALVVVGLLRVPSFLHPFLDGDEGTFAAVASLINAGGTLYEDGGVDNKFPGIYYLYALAFRLDPSSMHVVHGLALLSVGATAAVLWHCAGRGRSGWLAAIFYGVFTTVYYPKMQAAQTETFMMLPLAASYLLSVRQVRDRRVTARSALLAGALVAAGCAFKQVAIVQLPLTCAAVWLADRRRAPVWCALSLSGFAFGIGVMSMALVWAGSFDGFLRWTLVRLVSHYGPSAWTPSTFLTLFSTRFLPFLPCTIPLWVGLWLRWRRRAELGTAEWMGLGWFGLSFIGVCAGGRFFGHYFIQIVAPLCLVAAEELNGGGLESLRVRRWVIAGVAVPALGFFALALRFEAWSGGYGSPHPDYPAVVRYVESRSGPSDRILVYGSNGLPYLATQRLPATRFVAFLRGLDRGAGEKIERCWDCGSDVWTAFDEDVAKHPPTLIIDLSSSPDSDMHGYPMRNFAAFETLLQHYAHDTTIDGVNIWRRRTDALSRRSTSGEHE